jgi:predicted nucleotidyltransferase component of viral defense system
MMIYTETVSPELLEVFESFITEPAFAGFILGGGTSLALRFGHRKSIDLDFFSVSPFDSQQIEITLNRLFTEVEVVNRTTGSLCAVINKCKLDILHHAYPLLRKPVEYKDFRFLSIPDLAAMKINAVINRGSKKDFIDLLLLHENGVPLEKSLDFFSDKYGDAGRFLAVRSLAWFEDAESEPDPLILNGWTWEKVRLRMESLVKALSR